MFFFKSIEIEFNWFFAINFWSYLSIHVCQTKSFVVRVSSWNIAVFYCFVPQQSDKFSLEHDDVQFSISILRNLAAENLHFKKNPHKYLYVKICEVTNNPLKWSQNKKYPMKIDWISHPKKENGKSFDRFLNRISPGKTSAHITTSNADDDQFSQPFCSTSEMKNWWRRPLVVPITVLFWSPPFSTKSLGRIRLPSLLMSC